MHRATRKGALPYIRESARRYGVWTSPEFPESVIVAPAFREDEFIVQGIVLGTPGHGLRSLSFYSLNGVEVEFSEVRIRHCE
jgi:hypothetical protein